MFGITFFSLSGFLFSIYYCFEFFWDEEPKDLYLDGFLKLNSSDSPKLILDNNYFFEKKDQIMEDNFIGEKIFSDLEDDRGISEKEVLKKLPEDYVFLDYKKIYRNERLGYFKREYELLKFRPKYQTYVLFKFLYKGPHLSVCFKSHENKYVLLNKPKWIYGNSGDQYLINSNLVYSNYYNDKKMDYEKYYIVKKFDKSKFSTLEGSVESNISKNNNESDYYFSRYFERYLKRKLSLGFFMFFNIYNMYFTN